MSTLCLNCLGVYLTAAVTAEESRSGTWLRNPTLAAAGPRNCRLFLDVAGLIPWSITHWLTFHALKGFFKSSLVLSALYSFAFFVWFSFQWKTHHFSCVSGLFFSLGLWFRLLTWLARRENNGGVVLKKTVMFPSYGFWINPWITVLKLLQILQSLLTGKPGESISSAQWMGHIPQIIQSIKNWFLF